MEKNVLHPPQLKSNIIDYRFTAHPVNHPAKKEEAFDASAAGPPTDSSFENFRNWLLKKLDLSDMFILFMLVIGFMVTLYISVRHPELF